MKQHSLVKLIEDDKNDTIITIKLPGKRFSPPITLKYISPQSKIQRAGIALVETYPSTAGSIAITHFEYQKTQVKLLLELDNIVTKATFVINVYWEDKRQQSVVINMSINRTSRTIIGLPCEENHEHEVGDGSILLPRRVKYLEKVRDVKEIIDIIEDSPQGDVFWLRGNTGGGKTILLRSLMKGRGWAGINFFDIYLQRKLWIKESPPENKADIFIKEINNLFVGVLKNNQAEKVILVIDELDIIFSIFRATPNLITAILKKLFQLPVEWHTIDYSYVVSDFMPWEKREELKGYFESKSGGRPLRWQPIREKHTLDLLNFSEEDLQSLINELPVGKRWRDDLLRHTKTIFEATLGHPLLATAALKDIVIQMETGKVAERMTINTMLSILQDKDQASNLIRAIRYLCYKYCGGSNNFQLVRSEEIGNLIEAKKHRKLSRLISFDDSGVFSAIGIVKDSGKRKLLRVVDLHQREFLHACEEVFGGNKNSY